MKGKRRAAPTRGGVPDAFPLAVGLLFCSFAGGALYAAFGGWLDPVVWKMGLPVFLVALGLSGLLLSRRT